MPVFSNTAISLDGRISTSVRDHPMLGSAEDRRMMSELRARADAVLLGGNTFRGWPTPAVEAERPTPRKKPLLNAVLTRRGLLDAAADAWPDPRVELLILGPEGPKGLDVAAHRDRFSATVLTHAAPTPSWALSVLRARGAENILVEGGGDMIYQLLESGELHTLHLTLCPLLLGVRGAPSLADGPGFPWPKTPRVRLREFRQVGDELFLTYTLDR